jgi:hypothetical protein
VIQEIDLKGCDEERRAQLCERLSEYVRRREQIPRNPSAFHKAFVLSVLLKREKVMVADLRATCRRKSFFNEILFHEAICVISDYVLTGGENTGGGTGLPLLLPLLARTN